MSTEQKLLRQLREADRIAFRRIYTKYAPHVHGLALDYLKTSSGAKQVVMDVFGQLWEKRGTLTDNLSLSGYIFTLTYHALLRSFRSLNSQDLPQAVFGSLTLESGYVLEEKMLYQELESLYQQAICTLPDRTREVYKLSHHEGFTVQQIATQLKLPAQTVEAELVETFELLGSYFHQYAA